MKNKLSRLILTATLMAPSAPLWADETNPGAMMQSSTTTMSSADASTTTATQKHRPRKRMNKGNSGTTTPGAMTGPNTGSNFSAEPIDSPSETPRGTIR